MKRNFFTFENQEKICQYCNHHADRHVDLDKARLSLYQENQFIIGHEVRFCMQQGAGDRYFAFYYYHNEMVKDNYLAIDKHGNMSIVDGTFTQVDSNLLLSFKDDKFIMHNPAVDNNYVMKSG
jgi:hypothetical protein